MRLLMKICRELKLFKVLGPKKKLTKHSKIWFGTIEKNLFVLLDGVMLLDLGLIYVGALEL